MDTAALRDLLTSAGPFASIHLDSTHDTEDAARALDLRWRSVRERLAEQDAPPGMLDALERAIRTRSPAVGRAGRFLIADDGAVLVDVYLPSAPPEPVVRLSPLPYLLPLAGSGPFGVPHVVVHVDKIGADLRAVEADGRELGRQTVEGRAHPVHKVGQGGWSHRNIQQHAEETVKHNIADVATETAQLVRRTGAHLLVLAGDVEPRAALRRALPPSCDQIAVEVDAGPRGVRQTWPALQHDVDRLVAEQVWAERSEVLERFEAELGRTDGLAVQGLRPTAAALREANVEALVITDIDDATVWTGPRPQQVALEPAELDAMGAGGGQRGRADEVLPAAAIVTGAEVLADTEALDGDLQLADGVGALLRHG